jgi:hypothetical protein
VARIRKPQRNPRGRRHVARSTAPVWFPPPPASPRELLLATSALQGRAAVAWPHWHNQGVACQTDQQGLRPPCCPRAQPRSHASTQSRPAARVRGVAVQRCVHSRGRPLFRLCCAVTCRTSRNRNAALEQCRFHPVNFSTIIATASLSGARCSAQVVKELVANSPTCWCSPNAANGQHAETPLADPGVPRCQA